MNFFKKLKYIFFLGLLIFTPLFFLEFNNSEKSNLHLTSEEKEWIKKNPQIVYSSAPNFPPIDYVDINDFSHKGIVSDYIPELERKTGLKFIFRPYDSWYETLNSIKNREIDVITSIHENSGRSEFLLFTEPFMDIKYSLIVNQDRGINLKIKDLKGKKLLLVKGFAVSLYIKENYPGIEIEYVDNILEGVYLLSVGRGEAMIANVPVLWFLKSKNLIGNLAIAEEINRTFPVSLGIRRDKPMLASIINKAISSMSSSEKKRIYDKWVYFNYKKFWQTRIFWIVFVLFVIAIGLSFSLAMLWRQKAYELAKAKKEADLAKKKAEDADLAKSKFLANMTHEIRTPMNSVLGFAELLKDEIESGSGLTYIDNITNSGKSLLKLIDDILDMSKIEAGKLTIQYNRVDVIKVVDDIKQIFLNLVTQKGLKLFIEIESEIPKTLLLDELRLRQILTNLTGNAVKFTHDGYIRIVVSKKIRRSLDKKVDLIFVVEDSGIGIPAKDHDDIFTSFAQQRGQKANLYGGTGLGLSITKNLIEMMNGNISLESLPGKGSRFTFILHDVEIVEGLDDIPSEIDVKNRNINFIKNSEILIADDIPANRELLREYLKPYKFKVFEVETGEQVINFLKKRQPDIILLDIKMPVKDGYDVIDYMHENDLIKRVRVIVITSSGLGSKQAGIKSRGISGYIRKPVIQEDLIKELTKIVPYSSNTFSGDEYSSNLKSDDYLNKNDLLSMYETEGFDYNTFCSLFDGKVMDKWMEAEESYIIADIIEFADELIMGGTAFNASFFKELGKDIKSFASEFDIEGVKPLMQLFPGLLKKVKKMYKEE